MSRLEVRCCCRPEKLVGHCDWPGHYPRLVVHRPIRAGSRRWSDPVETFMFGLAEINLMNGEGPYQAVKAEDAPQWALEALPGWQEVERGQ